MFSETTFCKTHAHESCQRCGLKETTIGWLHTDQHTHGFRNEAFAYRREQSAFLLHLADANGYQSRNGITHHRQVEVAEETLGKRGQFKGKRRYLLPASNYSSQGTHHEDGYRECKVAPIVMENAFHERLLAFTSELSVKVMPGLCRGLPHGIERYVGKQGGRHIRRTLHTVTP